MLDTPSPNIEDRAPGLRVDMLVLHYTGMESANAALERLCDPDAKVSAHYLIHEDGTVCRLVDESKRAWHAGAACWCGETDVNGRSIGIELVNPGHEFGYRDFPEAQMTSLVALARDILARHPIPPRNVVGHSDVAPRRKQDPGERFDWRRLAREGIGLWPAPVAGADTRPAAVAQALAEVGYETDDLAMTIAAFQRHFRPGRIDGVADAETVAMLAGLARQVAAGEGRPTRA